MEMSDGQIKQAERIKKCLPAVKRIYQLLSDLSQTSLPIEGDGEDFDEARKNVYAPITLEIMKIVGESELTMGDVSFACSIAVNPLQAIVDNLGASIELGFKKANTKLWGKEEHQITLGDLDKVLKS